MSDKQTLEIKLCKHCHMELSLANPSGICSHVEYPDYCEVCKGTIAWEKEESILALRAATEAMYNEFQRIYSQYNYVMEDKDLVDSGIFADVRQALSRFPHV